jgi:hypothetical protein
MQATLKWWEYSYNQGVLEFPTDPRQDVTVKVVKRAGSFYWGKSKCSGDNKTLLCRKQGKVSGCPLTSILRVTAKTKRVTLGEKYYCKSGLFVVKRRGLFNE